MSQLEHTTSWGGRKGGHHKVSKWSSSQHRKTLLGHPELSEQNLTGVEEIIERVGQSMDDTILWLYWSCIYFPVVSGAVIETQSEMSVWMFSPLQMQLCKITASHAELLATRLLLVPNQEDSKTCPIFPQKHLAVSWTITSPRLTLPSAWMRACSRMPPQTPTVMTEFCLSLGSRDSPEI